MAALHQCKWPKLKTLLIKRCNWNSDSIAYLTAACGLSYSICSYWAMGFCWQMLLNFARVIGLNGTG